MTTQKRTPGRPKTGAILREAQVAFFLTPKDAEKLDGISKSMGFASRSQMITAIIERLLLGGFAPVMFLKIGLQFLKRMDQTGASKGGGMVNPFAPLPPLPLVDEPTDEEIQEFIAQLQLEHA
ncbi:MAG: hypothetical protein JO093_22195 [Acidobacteria bacterium]|nr:hypothetical protein [Acidobacteriota bacterium]